MDWKKASPELNAILAGAIEPFALVERRKMFGGLGLFLNGHMFACVYGNKIALKLGEEDRATAQAEVGAVPFEPMPGRVMKEYVVVSEAVWSEPESLEQWLLRSIEFVGSLPPKAPKTKKTRVAKGVPS